MTAKIVSAILNWLFVTVVSPILYYLYDYLRLKKIEKASKKAAEDLKNAKTKTDIDSAYDKLP